MGTKPFREFGELSPETLDVLDSLGYTHATPVQEACLPLFTGNKDVAVDACTGSGKTLAFVLPIIEKMRRLEEPLRPTQARTRPCQAGAATFGAAGSSERGVLSADRCTHRLTNPRAGAADPPRRATLPAHRPLAHLAPAGRRQARSLPHSPISRSPRPRVCCGCLKTLSARNEQAVPAAVTAPCKLN